ncbi:hypothetical protein J5N97_025644 [Dioscorea zingiberensis]|uniref:Cytochrome P450 n=1 Tax=Dioscorea zingiberensis TaxID=325984 RepID=A0A9D5C0M2_9LILI|nr:hypothetical protein J5N97_025644 [Dioscorea zingiberensis]
MGWPFIGEIFAFKRHRRAGSMGEFLEHHIAREASDHLSRSGVKSLHTEERYAIIRVWWPSSFLHVLGKHSISVEVGDAHKRMRSIVVNFLSNERLRTVFLQHSNRVASLLLSSLEENSIISAKDVALKFSFYVMVKEIFSMSPEEPENDKLMREYDTLVRGIASIPWNLPGSQYQQALESRKEIFKVFEQRMKERRGEKKGDDLLGWVMKNTEYSKEQMFDFILHTLFAGHDTTSRAISLMIYFLEGCPQAIQQLREEHLQVSRLKNQKGKSSLTWDDYKTMEFTKCGSCRANKRIDHFMAFGGGPRLCPGAELARLEMAVFIHHLILSYNWELVEPDHPMHVPAIHFFKGLPIKVQALISTP